MTARASVFVLLLLALASPFQADAQNKLKNIIPPSPELAQFQKYGDYPVGHTTGIPGISIPLYEISTGRLRVPITISYHASGFKVTDQSGIVGQGWSLNAGGRISRTLRRLPDEMVPYPSPFRSKNTLDDYVYEDFNYMFFQTQNGAYQSRDSEYDVFYYNAGESQGKFVLADNGNSTRKPVTIPFDPVKIASNVAGFNSNLEFFDVTTPAGDIYRYGKSITDAAANTENTKISASDAQPYISAWFLSEIISADKSDTVQFKYKSTVTIDRRRVDLFTIEDDFNQVTYGVQNACNDDGFGGPYPYYTMSTGTVENTNRAYNTKAITEIRYNQGKVVFNYSADDKKLLSIDVLSKSGTLMRKISLTQGLFANMPSTTGFFKLAGLKRQDAILNTIEEYGFAYDETVSFLNIDVHGLPYTTALDYWGFYNGVSTNGDMVPAFNISVVSANSVETSFSNRNSDANAMQSFILKKITYPTGGFTEFEYEGNRTTSNNDVVGGVRIKQLKSKTSASDPGTITTYVYGENEDGRGNLQVSPYNIERFMQTFKNWTYTRNEYVCACFQSRIRTVSSDQVDGSNVVAGSPVFYTTVTEYKGESWGPNIGKTVYKYDLPPIMYGVNNMGWFIARYNDWAYGKLQTKEVFKNTGTGTPVYEKILQEKYQYTTRYIGDLACQSVNFELYGKGNLGVNTLWAMSTESSQCSRPLHESVFEIQEYFHELGVNLLTKKTITEYTPSVNLINEETYTYGTDHNFPITQTITNSKGEQIRQTMKYPHDFQAIQPYSEMLNRNMIDPVLENTTVNITKSVQVRKEKTNFDFWLNGAWGNNTAASKILPKDINLYMNGNTTGSSVLFNEYDGRSNLREQQRKDDVKEVYLWGYESRYPVAKVSGSNFATVNGFITQSILDFPVSDQALRTELNKIRTGLGNTALVTTYTYLPGVGISSATDPNGNTMYYEYDNFQRLKTVKDKDGKILKHSEYQFGANIP